MKKQARRGKEREKGKTLDQVNITPGYQVHFMILQIVFLVIKNDILMIYLVFRTIVILPQHLSFIINLDSIYYIFIYIFFC